MKTNIHYPHINVILIGAGMYVCGRGTDGYGTILPALFEAKKKGLVDIIKIVGTNPNNKKSLDLKVNELNKKMGTNIKVEYYPKGQKPDKKAYEKLIESSNENTCAIVAIPDHLHFEVTKKLIENGIHSLVVKPLSPRIDEVKKLIALQKQNEVYCAVEFHKRYDEVNLKIREVINNNKIGDVLYCLVEYSQRNTIPKVYFKEWVKKTNVFQYLAVHYVDIIYFCTNFLPTRIMAIGQKNLLITEGIDAYDAIQAVIEWKDRYSEKKFVSTILTNWIDPVSTSAMSDQKIKVIGTIGRIESDQKNRGIRVISDSNGIEDINPYFSDFYYDISDESMNFKGYGCDSVLLFIEDSQSIINKDKAPKDMKGLRATFEDALISTAVIEAVNISLRNDNKWITIDKNFNIISNKGGETI